MPRLDKADRISLTIVRHPIEFCSTVSEAESPRTVDAGGAHAGAHDGFSVETLQAR